MNGILRCRALWGASCPRQGRVSHPPSITIVRTFSPACTQRTSGKNGRKVYMTRRITPQTDLDNLKKEARRWLKELRAGEPEARSRLERIYAKPPIRLGLRVVQHAIALEFGYSGWPALKKSVGMAKFEALARDMVSAYAG